MARGRRQPGGRRAEARASHDLTQGSIAKSLALFALPLLGTSVIQQLYGTVDLLFVGNVLGTDAMAALGISVLLITCLIGFFTGLSVGVNVVVARHVGSGKLADAGKAINTAVAMGLMGGVGLAVVGFAIAPSYLAWMATPSELVADALAYLRVYFVSMIAVVLYNQCAGALRGLGNSRTPFTAQLAGGVCNVALNALFLMVLGLGIAGSALATLFSQGIATLLCLRVLTRGPEACRLRAGDLAFHGDSLRGILAIGVPTGLQSLVITLSNVFVQHQINLLGPEAIAAFSAYFKVELPIYYALVSLGQAVTTFVAQNHAAGLEGRARKGTRACLGIGVALSVVLAAVLIGFGHGAFWIFSQQTSVIAYGRTIIGITFPLYWLYAFLEIYAGSMRGRGNSVAPMVIILLNVCVARTVILFALTSTVVTVEAVALVYPITWAATALCMTVGYQLQIRKRVQQDAAIAEAA